LWRRRDKLPSKLERRRQLQADKAKLEVRTQKDVARLAARVFNNTDGKLFLAYLDESYVRDGTIKGTPADGFDRAMIMATYEGKRMFVTELFRLIEQGERLDD
jgi:hypothetical protein